MQRAQRNVPVYLREQQQAEEKAQEKLLLLKEQQRDKQYMDEKQVCACVCGASKYVFHATRQPDQTHAQKMVRLSTRVELPQFCPSATDIG